jgi:hypothetical protein
VPCEKPKCFQGTVNFYGWQPYDCVIPFYLCLENY